MFYAILGIFVAAIVGLDQWTKLLVEKNLAFGEDLDSILGIFHITHVQNDGAAWGMWSGHTWLFLLVMLVFLALFAFILWKKWLNKKSELLCLAAILGGGLGNMIDRIFKGGLVTDMICLDFIDFPVFNVADCFITCGCIALMISIFFFDGKKRDETAPSSQEGAS